MKSSWLEVGKGRGQKKVNALWERAHCVPGASPPETAVLLAYGSVLLRYAGNLVVVSEIASLLQKCLSFVSLQRHLGKNIKFGQKPPNAIPMKKAGSGDASSEEDLFLTSPMEIVTQQDIVLSDTENKVSFWQGRRNCSEAGRDIGQRIGHLMTLWSA